MTWSLEYTRQFIQLQIMFVEIMTDVKGTPSVPNFEKRCRQSNNKCICQICTCGKHRCPHPHVMFTGESTQHHDYKQYHVKVQRAHRPECKFRESHYDPEIMKSTYTEDFKSFICPACEEHGRYTYQPNRTKFSASTEFHDKNAESKDKAYEDQFYPQKVQFDGPIEHKASQKNPEKQARFDAVSSYSEDYKAPRVERLQCLCFIQQLPKCPIQCPLGKEHVRFDSTKNKWK